MYKIIIDTIVKLIPSHCSRGKIFQRDLINCSKICSAKYYRLEMGGRLEK